MGGPSPFRNGAFLSLQVDEGLIKGPGPQQWGDLDRDVISVLGRAHTITPARTGYVRPERKQLHQEPHRSFTGPKASEDSKRAREGAQLLSWLLNPGPQLQLANWQTKTASPLFIACRVSNMKEASRTGLCSLWAYGSSTRSSSQHLAWVHEASGVQHDLELPHGLHAHSTNFLLQ